MPGSGCGLTLCCYPNPAPQYGFTPLHLAGRRVAPHLRVAVLAGVQDGHTPAERLVACHALQTAAYGRRLLTKCATVEVQEGSHLLRLSGSQFWDRGEDLRRWVVRHWPKREGQAALGDVHVVEGIPEGAMRSGVPDISCPSG